MLFFAMLLVIASAHAQQPPYNAQFFYAQPHYVNVAYPSAYSMGDFQLRGGSRVLYSAPPQEADDVRAAHLAHLDAHDAALVRRGRRDTFVAVRPVLAVGPQFELPPLEGRLAVELHEPSVSQQAVARGALPVAAVHDQQVSPLQERGLESLSPVHVHRNVPAEHPALFDGVRPAAGGAPAAALESLSARAALFGAVPVAAVHDQQTAPHQWAGRHQTRPLYVERWD